MEVTDGSTTYTYQTRCFDMTASAADVEVKIEERFIDDVTVILDTESTTFRSYSIVLDVMISAASSTSSTTSTCLSYLQRRHLRSS